ncbi:MAG: DNA mismatch repair protein MutS [Anaerolineaceae bacterium]
MPEDVTPIRQQYLDIKKQYPDTILFFRLGDFYETFDNDAETTSRELDLVLTSRGVAKGQRIPMAGIPYHAVENYLSRLIEKGYHVAICEQVGDQPARGLFPREVVRVVTPGTVIEPGLLRGDRNNYLAAMIVRENRAGLAFTDITTGEFAATELDGEDVYSEARAEISRLNPAELLLPENLRIGSSMNVHLTTLPEWRFESGRCSETLMRHFQVSTLDGFGLQGYPLAVIAAGVILQYVKETQPEALGLIDQIQTYSTSDFMVLDAATRRNLELTETIRKGEVQGSLLHTLDHTISPMGHRQLRQWISKPLLDIAEIHGRQEKVAVFLSDGLLRADFRSRLKAIPDLERITTRVVSGSALPRELVSLRISLEQLPGLIQLVSKADGALMALLPNLDPCTGVFELLSRAISDDPPATLANTGIIRSGYSSELDTVIDASRHAREWISNLEAIERERTGIKTLKVGYNKVFGYYIEITHANASQAPQEYIRKQTLVNAERYITPEMKEYESLVLNAEERIREIEQRLYREILKQVAGYASQLLGSSRTLGELDVYAAFAENASLGKYVAPEMSDSTILDIRDGRHPVVEESLRGERFVPNDAVFEDGEIIRIITGPNMSGKSTFLRQVALIVLMAQIGSYVPASSAKIGVVDRIFTRIGAQDEIHAGQSTFMVEMIETANILNHASPRSLLILDEIGRGTSTYDGLSIAWAVVEYIHNHPRLKARTLFATHYHELTQLSDLLPGVRNYNVAVIEASGQVVFLHKIAPGGADRSYGIHVAQLAGIPRPVIQRAGEILQQLQASSGTAVEVNTQSLNQMALFPETNPLLDDLKALDVNSIPPVQALNILYEWQRKYLHRRD